MEKHLILNSLIEDFEEYFKYENMINHKVYSPEVRIGYMIATMEMRNFLERHLNGEI